MRPVLKRILLHGILTAAALAIVGVGYAELAGLWLVAKAPQRPMHESPVAGPPAVEPLADSLKYRVPMMMAMWGFLFVAVGELALAWWRKRKSAVKAEPKPDPTQELLEQLLKAEAEKAANRPAESPA